MRHSSWRIPFRQYSALKKNSFPSWHCLLHLSSWSQMCNIECFYMIHISKPVFCFVRFSEGQNITYDLLSQPLRLAIHHHHFPKRLQALLFWQKALTLSHFHMFVQRILKRKKKNRKRQDTALYYRNSVAVL